MLSASSGENNDPSTVQVTVSKGKITVAGTTNLSQWEQALLKFITNQTELVVLRLMPVIPNPNQKGGGNKSVLRN
jgi:hypothetical protein